MMPTTTHTMLSYFIAFLVFLEICKAHNIPIVKAKTEKLVSFEGGFTEGPIYDPIEEEVYFSDIFNDKNHIYSIRTKTSRVWRDPSGRANGLSFDREGRILICEGADTGGGRRLVSVDKNAQDEIVLADKFNSVRLNSPNDVAVASNGFIYFTDPRYTDRYDMEMQEECVFLLIPGKDVGPICIITLDIPNGVAFSPDEGYLIVTENNNKKKGGSRKVHMYELGRNGRPVVEPEGHTILYDFETGRGPDGVCLDSDGYLYITAGRSTPAPHFLTEDLSFPGGVYIYNINVRDIVGYFPIEEDDVTNCIVGKNEHGVETMFVTAGTSLYSIEIGSVADNKSNNNVEVDHDEL
eukprot:TRINITY_DN4349_c0_g1_i1.p1 TRINITY_DN4349_c0_g1~~TRINITY_DN4349_c0_g1_i1.p1  ORF type:complete len:351 (+),score=54.20 TRINITY_DN4349_c0_g1_i1:792-1844(+)